MEQIGTNIQIDDDIAEELVGHLKNKTTDMADAELQLPYSYFTSHERLEDECRLMRSLPLMAGHISEIENPGDFITRTILDVPLIIVRRADGSVATYRNICRHRGGTVEGAPRGNKRVFMCQYHGWAYDAERGALKPVVYEDTFGKIDYACSGLHIIKTELKHGLIFITLEPGNQDTTIDQYLGEEMDYQLSLSHFDSSILFMQKDFEKEINWKLVLDGAHDPLHLQFLHSKPGGVGERIVTNASVFRSWGRHGRSFQPRTKLKTLVQSGQPITSSSKYITSNVEIFPNVQCGNAPDHVEFWTVWPVPGHPSRCIINIRFFVRPEILTPEMEGRIQKSWEVLEQAALEEDFPMEESIQKNASAVDDGYFRYGRNEKALQHFHRHLDYYIKEMKLNRQPGPA